jgi:hypothetical protein
MFATATASRRKTRRQHQNAECDDKQLDGHGGRPEGETSQARYDEVSFTWG